MKKPQAAVAIVGIGDDGCGGLSSLAFNAVARSQVLVGGERHLEFFPDFKGEKIVIKNKLSETVKLIADRSHENNVCVLASGDPMFFGIGSLVVKAIGIDHADIIPAPSSIQWACARLGLKWDDATLLSVHGKSIQGLQVKLRRAKKAIILTDSENAPNRIALLLSPGAWRCHVLEHLGGEAEKSRTLTVDELRSATDIAPLNILVLERIDRNWREPPFMPYMKEEDFARRMPKLGLITKREVRILTLATLQLPPDGVMWDIGAGSGSVAIEAALMMPEGHAYAIECDPEGVDICLENVQNLQVDNVTVIPGRAPEALTTLAQPDSVFIGGSKGSMIPIVTYAFDKLRPGGRLVINAVTVDNVSEAYHALRQLGIEPELTVMNISRGANLAGKYLRYEALNPIHIFAATKPTGDTP